MADIEILLPQRYPFLFLDDIIFSDSYETVGVKTYDSSFHFYQEDVLQKNIVPNLILIESIVQCGGAGLTQTGLLEKASWGLASLEKVQFFGVVEAGEQVSMKVYNLKVSSKLLKQRGIAFCKEQKVLEATWLCLKLH